MSALAHVLRTRPRSITSPEARAAIADMTYELIPQRTTVPSQLDLLPDRARVSVTASPAGTLGDTLDLCAELLDRGHRPVPHLAARMVADAAEAKAIADRVVGLGVREVFCIAGDREQAGGYPDAMAFLQGFLDATAGELDAVGVSGYPDGHAFIDDGALDAALCAKQDLFSAAGVQGHVTTQMCFSTDTVRHWLSARRAAGISMPVHLGVPGVVERTRLLAMGLRLGIGASLRYLEKNRSGLVRLLTSASYDPGDLVGPLAPDFARLSIERLHVFTFNRVAATREWQRVTLG